jgi:MFS family permease
MAGIIYYTAFVFGPIFGLVIEKYGIRSRLSIIAFIIIVPAITLIFLTTIIPIPWMILLGLTYSMAPTVLWGSLPKLVPKEIVGTSMGLNSCSQMLGVAITQIVIGQLKDHDSTYQSVYYYFLAIALLGVLLAIVLNWHKGYLLNTAEEEKIADEDIVTPLIQ